MLFCEDFNFVLHQFHTFWGILYCSPWSPSMTLKEDRSLIGLLPHLPAPCRYLRQPNHDLMALYLCAWPAELNISMDILISSASHLVFLNSWSLSGRWDVQCQHWQLSITGFLLPDIWIAQACWGSMKRWSGQCMLWHPWKKVKQWMISDDIIRGQLMIKMGSHLIVHLFYKNRVMISDLLGWHLNNIGWVLFPIHELSRETHSFECIMYCLYIYLKNSFNLQCLSKLRVLSWWNDIC